MPCRLKSWGVVLILTLIPLFYVILFQKGGHYLLNSSGESNSVSSPRIPTESKEPSVRRILLVTYGRSGSTFLSYVLKEAPEAFFFFEPLRSLLLSATKGLDIINSYQSIGGTYYQPQELPVSNLTSYERQAIDVMSDLFECDISKYPVTNYRSNHFLLHGNVAKVAKCLWSMVNASYLNLSDYLQCLTDFFFSCQHAPLRIFKVIRMPVRSLFPLLRRFPDLQVVYLVRDPRAVLASQKEQFGRAPTPANFCRMVVDDVKHMQLLLDTFPGRGVTIRYEDISSDPLNATQRLYSALGLKLTSQIMFNVRTMTSAKSRKDTKDPYTAFRSDSKKAAERWRTKVPFADVLKSDPVCREAFKLLGYKGVSSQKELRNTDVSLVDSSAQLPLIR